MTFYIYIYGILLLAVCVVLFGCEDSGTPRRSWVVVGYAIVDDVLYVAVTREFGQHIRRGSSNLLTIEKMDCYTLEFQWPLQTGVPNTPLGGRGIPDCGGAKSGYEAREFFRRSVEGFEEHEGQAGPGLPSEVGAEVERELAAKIEDEVFASALVDGEELFLVRSRSLRRPSAIVNKEGHVVYELPDVSIQTTTIWNPASQVIVFFDWSTKERSRDRHQLPRESITGLADKVVVYNYGTGERQQYEISERQTAEFLLELEKETQ